MVLVNIHQGDWIMDLEDITDQAMHLSETDRAQLAHQLLESLEDDSGEEIAAIWLTEAKRRAKELDEGKVQAITSKKYLA